jgi:Transposase IS4
VAIADVELVELTQGTVDSIMSNDGSANDANNASDSGNGGNANDVIVDATANDNVQVNDDGNSGGANGGSIDAIVETKDDGNGDIVDESVQVNHDDGISGGGNDGSGGNDDGFEFCAGCGLRANDEHGPCECGTDAPGPLTQLVQIIDTMDDMVDGGNVGQPGLFTSLLMDIAPSIVDDADNADDDVSTDDVTPTSSIDPDDVNLIQADEDPEDYEDVNSDEDDPSDDDVAVGREFPDEAIDEEETELMDEAFITSLGGTLDLNNMDKEALRALQWGNLSSSFETNREAYPRLKADVAKPIRALMDVADSPIKSFLYFVPKTLWVRIADETNRYKRQTDEARAVKIRRNQMTNRNRTSTPETVKQIRRRLQAEAPYEPHEIIHVLGLLVAHMLCPRKGRFSSHWSMTEDGAMPSGTFSKYMARNRCTTILRDLHFVNNESPRARDKIWKLRPVIETLQQRFLTGWTKPTVFSFDEGVLPATSRRNTTRMFMPDKPHRYGTKMFMVCDSASAYCHR